MHPSANPDILQAKSRYISMQKNILTCISAAEGTADEPSLTTHKATVLGREVRRITKKVEHNLPELPGIRCG